MKMKSKINIVQLIIPAFIVLMIIMLVANQLSVSEYITLSLRRTCMLLVMVLAVTPTIYSGVGINYGVTVGFCLRSGSSSTWYQHRTYGYSADACMYLFQPSLWTGSRNRIWLSC